MLKDEQVLKKLDEIISDKGNEKDKYCNEDFKYIKRISFIEYDGLKGRLIWDHDRLSHELTFIADETGKHYSLKKSQSADNIADLFYDFAKKAHKFSSKITIVYGSMSAKYAADKLKEYFNRQQSDTILLTEKEYQYLEKNNQLTTDKVILLGHNSFEKEKINNVASLKIGPGMEIRYNNHICVLMSDRSAIKNGEAGHKEFKQYYNENMPGLVTAAPKLDISVKYDDAIKSTTASMYYFLLTTFVEQEYMEDFLSLKYIASCNNKADELWDELNNNPEYKKYITPDLLNRICEDKKYFLNPPKERDDKNENVWEKLYNTDLGIWSVQRYWNKNEFRIFNTYDKTKAYGKAEHILCPILEHCHRKEQLEKVTNRDWGIVFGGGGGKGAYELGVWKWLIEHGIADKITGISGASVGALNSLLFVEGNYELAENIWRSVTSDVIMEKELVPVHQSQKKLSDLLGKYMPDIRNICNQKKLIYSSLTCIKNDPKLLDYLVDYKKYKEKFDEIKKDIKVNYYSWASKSNEDIKEIVLASAAVPWMKKPRQFEGRKFVDGGLTDNLPLSQLVEDGFHNIIVIQLDDGEDAYNKAIMNLDISNVKIYLVKPSKDLGKMQVAGGALTKYRIDTGYQDANSQLKDMLKSIS